jgi:hypothetical protein
MISAKLIIKQWRGILGYEIIPISARPISDPDANNKLINELLSEGLDMYIHRYLLATVWHPRYYPGQPSLTAPYIVYRRVPNPNINANIKDNEPILYIRTSKNIVYKLILCFDYLAHN